MSERRTGRYVWGVAESFFKRDRWTAYIREHATNGGTVIAACGHKHKTEAAADVCALKMFEVITMREKAAQNGERWTLYDLVLERVWGGDFGDDGSARRWKTNAGLPPSVVPMKAAEAEAREKAEHHA